tara:strand:+ start:69 stop:200 length:132 start_codon:yes stop_codon:yes gene_type:complete
MEVLSQADLQIISELDKKIGYYTKRINECTDEKRWIINRRENH